MRELKFRVWDGDYKMFITKQHFIISIFDTHLLNDNERFTIQQFTGLTDKNGKEIYEGDIIQKIVNGEHIYTYIVGYDESKASFTIKDSLESLISFVPVDTFQIIGNIFENSDLLKQ